MGLAEWWQEFREYNSPDAWSGVLADTYAWAQYGRIPVPGVELPLPPAPAAPQTASEMVTWSPELAEERNRAAYDAWVTEMRDIIAAAEASGSYTPAGRLPVTAEGVSDWFSGLGEIAPFLVVAAVAGLLIGGRR